MKKTLSMILVLVLMLSLVSVIAFADGSVTLNVVTSYGGDDGNRKNFENAVKAVAQKINTDYENAGKQYEKVDKFITDTIKALEGLREAHRLMGKWIGAAQNQLPDLEIRKLTKNNPTMKAKFEAIGNKEENK